MAKDKIAFPKQDNWKMFSYDERILDSLANLFHLKSPCAAVVKYENILYLSYNTQIANKDILDVTKQQKLLINCIKNSIEEAITSYLLLNSSYLDFIKNQIRSESVDEFKKELNNLAALHKNFKPQILKDLKDDTLDLNKYKEINNSYLKIIQYVKNVFNRGDVDVAEQLLRPLQDCTKIKYFIDNGYDIGEVKLLDNKEAIHAEYNITQHLPFAGEVDYIGTSKLCCANCHKYLEKKVYVHRGTHGVADQAWKMYLDSPQAEVFKESVLKDATDLEEGQEVFQYRKLSFDYFEKEIPFSEEKTLCKLKCDLLGSHNYDISDEYGYYIFTENGYEQIG